MLLLPQPPADRSDEMIVALFAAFAAVVTSWFQNIGVVKYGPTDAIVPGGCSGVGVVSSLRSSPSSVVPVSPESSSPGAMSSPPIPPLPPPDVQPTPNDAARRIGTNPLSRIRALCGRWRA